MSDRELRDERDLARFVIQEHDPDHVVFELDRLLGKAEINLANAIRAGISATLLQDALSADGKYDDNLPGRSRELTEDAVEKITQAIDASLIALRQGLVDAGAMSSMEG